jgi:hypothetical protein
MLTSEVMLTSQTDGCQTSSGDIMNLIRTNLNTPRTNSAARRSRSKIASHKRKLNPLCRRGGCRKRTLKGHTYCEAHLRGMSLRAAERIETRREQGVCTYCGRRPQFWGQRCILCRPVGENPLPRAARTALKLYRENEARHAREQIAKRTQSAAQKLLAGGKIKDRAAEALRLYVGLDDGEWRTYGQVGAVMNLSPERVRQLLSPSKEFLAFVLKGQVPWVRMVTE